MHELFSGLDCCEPEKVTYFTEGLRPSLKVKVLERMPETPLEAEELARTFNSISRRVGGSSENEQLEKILLNTLSAQNQEQPTTSIPEKPPAWLETLLGKLSPGFEPTKTTVAALNDSYSENPRVASKLQREIQQLKDMI